MTDTKKRILAEIKKHRGEICISSLELVRLLGFKEDEDDYYYYVQTLNYKRQYVWVSCVGWMHYLKGYLPKKVYAEIDRVFKLNVPEMTNVEKLISGLYDELDVSEED